MTTKDEREREYDAACLLLTEEWRTGCKSLSQVREDAKTLLGYDLTIKDVALMLKRGADLSRDNTMDPEMPPRPQVAPATHAEHLVGLKHTGPYGCGDRSCRICFG